MSGDAAVHEAGVGIAAGVLIAMVPSGVSASDDEVRREGSCSGRQVGDGACWDDDERIEVRGRVEDTGRGQTWAWKIKHNGASPPRAVR